MTDQLLYGVAIVPAILGLTQVAKQLGIPGKFAPLIAVSLGLLAGLAQAAGGAPIPGANPWISGAITGIALGLAASGLYSGAVVLTPSKPVETAPETTGPTMVGDATRHP